MKTITFTKIMLAVTVVGTITFLSFKWNVKLDPPAPIAPAQSQILVDVLMPAYAKAEQNDFDLYKRDPEAYANRFNRNSELYNRSLTLINEKGVNVGDTVQLKYFLQYNPPQETYWELTSTKSPFIESVENEQYTYTEYVKGVVRAVK